MGFWYAVASSSFVRLILADMHTQKQMHSEKALDWQTGQRSAEDYLINLG